MARTRDISEWTARLLFAFVLIAIIYDVYAISYGPPGASISATMNQQMRDHPILAVLIGLLVGTFAKWDAEDEHA